MYDLTPRPTTFQLIASLIFLSTCLFANNVNGQHKLLQNQNVELKVLDNPNVVLKSLDSYSSVDKHHVRVRENSFDYNISKDEQIDRALRAIDASEKYSIGRFLSFENPEDRIYIKNFKFMNEGNTLSKGIALHE